MNDPVVAFLFGVLVGDKLVSMSRWLAFAIRGRYRKPYRVEGTRSLFEDSDNLKRSWSRGHLLGSTEKHRAPKGSDNE